LTIGKKFYVVNSLQDTLKVHMSQINQFLQDLNNHSDAVKKCTRPLSHLGVTCFYYVSIKNNGDHFLLTDCPNVDEYYYQEEIYFKDPYLRHPDNYQSGFFFFDTHKKEEFDQSLAYLSRNFQICPLVGLCKKQQDSVEFFGFWGDSDKSPSFEHIYLNYSNLLKSFAIHFKQECSSILQESVAPYLSLEKLIGPDLFNSKPTSISKIDSKSLQHYLIELGFGHEVVKADSLSLRERQCIKLLLQGKSMKETAVVLNLSPRTIEHYFENIKNKFNCQYKHELFAIAEKLIELELL